MTKLLTPEIFILGGGLLALFITGMAVVWLNILAPAPTDQKDTSDTGASLMDIQRPDGVARRSFMV